MQVALDMDAVMAEITPAEQKYVKAKWGKTFEKKEYVYWDWVQNALLRGVPSDADMIEMYATIWRDWWDEVKPTEPNLEEKVEKLAKFADVTVVTSGSAEQAGGKIKWLYKYGLRQIPILFVPYGKTKERLPYHIFIDDRQETIERVVSAGKIGFVYDQPWNAKCKVGFRVKSLNNVVSFLEGKGIENGRL